MSPEAADDLYADLVWRGLVHQVTDAGLGARLAAGPLTVYFGIDATADSLHVGSLVGLVTLQRFQRAGHRPVACLGGATSLIGDPSGRSAERIVLSQEEVRANAAGIRPQVERFIDFAASPDTSRSGKGNALLVDNADWLGPVRLTDFLRDVGTKVTVNTMMAKESVRCRLEGRDQGISYAEFSYMLLQAYDFLYLYDTEGCRLQVGGSDQWGNITAGIDLVRRARNAEVYGLTWPLLTKADGAKFGKSEAGNVWLDPARTSPYQFFQFWLQTDDRDVGLYLRQLTFLDPAAIEALDESVVSRPQAREAQRVLATEVTSAVHGPEAAAQAAGAASALFGGELDSLDEATLLDVFAEAPSSEVQSSRLTDGDGLGLVDLLAETGLVASKSAARTAVEQGGVYVNNRRETAPDRRLATADLLFGRYIVLRRGKRSYHLVRLR